jgi:fibronectin-binding autotransporter adhesin
MTHWTLLQISTARVARPLTAVVLWCLLGALPAQAATRTWDGSSSALWSEAANWAENAVPGPGDDLVFGGVTPNNSTTNDLAAGTQFNSLSFTSEAYQLHGNAITLGPGGIIQNSATTVTTHIVLPIVLDAVRTVTMSGNGLGALTLAGIVSGNGGLDVSSTATENRTLRLEGNNTFIGGISVTDLNVDLQHASGFGTGTVNNVGARIVMNNLTVANALNVEGCGPDPDSAAIDHNGVWSGAVTVTGDVCLGLFGGDLVFSGPVMGSHRITATQFANTAVTFSGNSPGFSGELAAKAGTLRVNASFPAASADLSTDSVAGATLAGTGSVGGSVSVGEPGARLAPGVSPGILSTGHLTLGIGALLVIELNGPAPGTGYDRVNVTGQTSLNDATLDVTVGFAPPPGTQFTIISNDGADAVDGTFAGLAEGAAFNVNGTTFEVSYAGGDGNDVVLTVTQQVPTLPLSMLVLLAAALLALSWRACGGQFPTTRAA